MVYTPQTWADLPSETTPLSASRLQYIEDGIAELGEWTTYTPTFGNVSLTGATVTGRYTQVGKTVVGLARITTGTAAPVSGNITLTPPVSINTSNFAGVSVVGVVTYRDTSSGLTVPGFALYSTTSSISLRVSDHSTTYGSITNTTSSTIPFTWASGDIIDVEFTYEAA